MGNDSCTCSELKNFDNGNFNLQISSVDDITIAKSENNLSTLRPSRSRNGLGNESHHSMTTKGTKRKDSNENYEKDINRKPPNNERYRKVFSEVKLGKEEMYS